MTDQEKDQTPQPASGNSPARTGNKPVVLYIMVLFIAAFLLMALSFLMHQRSNSEVVGELKSSVSALQEVQALQNQVIQLQQELKEAKALAEAFQDANETSRNQASELAHQLEETVTAMNWFCQLNEAYVLEDTEKCLTILQVLEQDTDSPLCQWLPKEEDGVEGSQTAPYQRYLEIRDALAQTAAEE